MIFLSTHVAVGRDEPSVCFDFFSSVVDIGILLVFVLPLNMQVRIDEQFEIVWLDQQQIDNVDTPDFDN